MFSILRGTQAYWEKQKSRIRHMIAMKGPPTAFATFSSADVFWTDIEDYFQSYVDMNVAYCIKNQVQGA